MSRIFMMVKTDMGPRTQIFSAPEEIARLFAKNQTFDAICILPDEGPYSTVAQLTTQRAKSLAREISRRKSRKRLIPQPQPLRIARKP